jgi:hypothetical protein
MQSNTNRGTVSERVAGEDLSAFGVGAANGGDVRLVKLANSGGESVVLLPEANDDDTLYLLIGGNTIGLPVAIDPLDPGQNQRATLKSTCVCGDDLVLADVATAADKGKLRKLPTVAGTYRVIGTAEESGVDGQQVLFRRNPKVVTVA